MSKLQAVIAKATPVGSRVATLALALCALFVLLIPIKTPFNSYDEGYSVFYATRIMNGDVPYRDFWTVYPPGQFLILAALFKVFGTSLLVSRAYDTVVRFAMALSAFLIVKRVGSRSAASITLLAFAAILGSARFYSYALFPALALSLLSILSALSFVDTYRRRWLFISGALIGSASFIRWDVALYTGASLIMAMVVLRLLHATHPAPLQTRSPALLLDIAVLASVALVLAFSYYAFVGLRSGYGNLWDQAFLFPTFTVHALRRLPYPALLLPLFLTSRLHLSVISNPDSALWSWFQFYAPLGIYGTIFAFNASLAFRKRLAPTTQSFGGIAAAILGLLLFGQALNRYDSIHVLPSSLLALMVLISLPSKDMAGAVHRVVQWALLLLSVGLVMLYITPPLRYLSLALWIFPPLGCYSQIERASCIPLQSSDQEQAVNYITAQTSENDSIFVGNQRHDLVSGNEIGLYFLTARRSATRYSELHPGVATTLPVQQAIANELETKRVEWILLVNVPEPDEPNASAISSGVHYLDDFIRSRYSIAATFGDYRIWELGSGRHAREAYSRASR